MSFPKFVRNIDKGDSVKRDSDSNFEQTDYVQRDNLLIDLGVGTGHSERALSSVHCQPRYLSPRFSTESKCPYSVLSPDGY